MGIIQIFWPFSNKLQYIRQNEVALHFFIITNCRLLLFLWLLGSNKGFLNCAGKSKFLDESYHCRCTRAELFSAKGGKMHFLSIFRVF